MQKGPEEDVQLEIFLSNGKSVKCDIMSTDQTDDVLETAATVIGLDENLTYYFGLYMVEDASGKYTVRKLQDFESPHVSLSRAPEGHKIMVRCVGVGVGVGVVWCASLCGVVWRGVV